MPPLGFSVSALSAISINCPSASHGVFRIQYPVVRKISRRHLAVINAGRGKPRGITLSSIKTALLRTKDHE
jgi:hypothetical protein